MSVHKDEKTGKWSCSVWYKDWQGLRKHTTKRGFLRKKEAEVWERNFLARKQRQNPKLGAVIELYLSELDNLVKLGTIRPSTAKVKEQVLVNFALPHFKDVNVENISPADITKWLSYISSHSKLRKRLSSNYLNTIRNVMNQLFQFSTKNFLTENNPIPKTVAVKQFSNDYRAKLLTIEQYNIFYASLKKEVYRVFFNLIFWSGLRIGEALAITPADITPYKINITKAIALKSNGKFGISSTKNKQSVRTVEIPQYIYNQLKDFISHQYELGENELIFSNLSASAVRGYMTKRCKELGLPHISPHILRHSYASLLYAATGNILVVANQIGHASTNTTFKYYAHALPTASREAVDTLSQKILTAPKNEPK